jgi:uncharacterized protein YbjT (DUF2867 family)
MRILLTGSTGYIGKRLLNILAEEGHEITCIVRNLSRAKPPKAFMESVSHIEADLLYPFPPDLKGREFNVAFYLVHSMATSVGSFMEEEARSARNFADFLKDTSCRQVIYLSGISNSQKLSKHLQSRRNVEDVLRSSGVPLTVLRAGIIVGSGSASFEIIRDLMEKMPMLIAPRWINTLCQPIAVTDVMKFLTGCMLNPNTYNQVFDIGGTEVLTYKEMLLKYAEVRGLKRRIYTTPLISPRLSSYWLYFITTTSYHLAVNLVDSMKVQVVCNDNNLKEMLEIQCFSYKEACQRALTRINLDTVASSWTDAVTMGKQKSNLFNYLDVPSFGILRDRRKRLITVKPDIVLNRIFSIGGNTGWYFANWIWEVRGLIDRLAGGVGLRRGRRNITDLIPGDALDFWRVLIANREEGRLLLFAEMKVPGEAWLEFRVVKKKDGNTYLYQTATFMPKGLSGRLYWYLLLPVHLFMFRGMANSLVHPPRKGESINTKFFT